MVDSLLICQHIVVEVWIPIAEQRPQELRRPLVKPQVNVEGAVQTYIIFLIEGFLFSQQALLPADLVLHLVVTHRQV